MEDRTGDLFMNNHPDCSQSTRTDLLLMTMRWTLTPSFIGPGSEKKWCSHHGSRPQGEWDRVAELMMIKFGVSGHPVFGATSPLSRGTLKSKGGG